MVDFESILKESGKDAITFSMTVLIAQLFKMKVLKKGGAIDRNFFLVLISQIIGFSVYNLVNNVLGLNKMKTDNPIMKSVLGSLKPAIMIFVSHGVLQAIKGQKINYSSNFLLNTGITVAGLVVYQIIVNTQAISSATSETGYKNLENTVFKDMIDKFGGMVIGDLLGAGDASILDFDLEAGASDNIVATIIGIFIEGVFRPINPLMMLVKEK